MAFILDTGVLLRLADRAASGHPNVREAVRFLKQGGQQLLTTTQNVVEFWNVATRPASARGGLGLRLGVVLRKVKLIESMFPLLPETPAIYPEWKRLVQTHRVLGVQVHDARIAAIMHVYGITDILTLNKSDFQRYDGITPVEVDEVLQTRRRQ